MPHQTPTQRSAASLSQGAAGQLGYFWAASTWYYVAFSHAALYCHVRSIVALCTNLGGCTLQSCSDRPFSLDISEVRHQSLLRRKSSRASVYSTELLYFWTQKKTEKTFTETKQATQLFRSSSIFRPPLSQNSATFREFCGLVHRSGFSHVPC